MNAEDRLKVAEWLEGQIRKLEALPRAEAMAEQIERLRRTAEEQKDIGRRTE